MAQYDWLHHVTVINCTCKDSISQCFNENLALRVTFHKNKIFLMKSKSNSVKTEQFDFTVSYFFKSVVDTEYGTVSIFAVNSSAD